jgi:mannose-6-phosphate isomerase
MFVLEPIFHHTIWGGDRLVGVYGERAVGLGHLYSLRCRDENSNMILNGEFAGRRLFDAIGAYPLSVAIDDAAADLSVQVHPGGAAAKYESYYFMEAPKSGCIYCGIEDIDAAGIRAACESGTILTRVKRVSAKQGDYIHIEPGTVHALTAGSLVYEIEQGGDCTYRLFDHNRIGAGGDKRDLQVERAMGVIDPAMKAAAKEYLPNTVFAEKTYATKLLTGISDYMNNGPTRECLTLLSGGARADGAALKPGMSVLLDPGEKLSGLEIEKCIVARALT